MSAAANYYSSLPNVDADDDEIRRYAILLDNLGIGLVAYSPDAAPWMSNNAAGRLLGEGSPRWMDQHGETVPCDQLPQKIVSDTEQPLFDRILTVDDGAQGKTWLSVNALPVFSVAGKIRRILLTLNDITDLRQLQQEVSRLTTHDSLTGVFKKDVILPLLDTEIRRAQRYGTPFAIARLDIDHFSDLCQKHGRLNGDLVLVGVGKTFREGVREIDMIGRIEEDEFLVVLPNIRQSDAVIGMERLRTTIESRPFTSDRLAVTISGGIAEYAGETSAALLEHSRSLLISAKEAGRNRFCLDPEIS